MNKQVRIFDTTLRDGDQTPGVHLSAAGKEAIARDLDRFGVATIEAGFPASSPGDCTAVAHVAKAAGNAEVAAFARCMREDIEIAARALADARHPVIHVALGTSDIHIEMKLGMNRPEAVRAIRNAVSCARAKVPEVQFSAEDATRSERAFLRECLAVAIEAGATRVNIADTVGCATPVEFGALIADVVRFVEDAAIVSAHCHDDLGMATANTIAAVERGAGQVEVTVNGIGERAGNARIEEVAAALALKGIADTGLDLSVVTGLSRRVAELTGMPVPPNRAVVGANAFAHSSGVHQDGILKAPSTYTFVPPDLVGAPGHRFVLTARSGRKAVASEARRMGYDLTNAQVNAVYHAFLAAADCRAGAVSDEELADIIRRTCALGTAS